MTDPRKASEAEAESITRRAEDVATSDEEAGRHERGTKGPTERPAGGSTARDRTGIDPQDPITSPDRPNG